MRLDRTSIAIRERSFLDIVDLALRVIARYTKELVTCWAAAVIPLMLVNYLLTRWIAPDLDDSATVIRYVNVMILLALIQAPLVSVFLTPYLGRAVFMHAPSRRELLRDIGKSATPLIWCVMILRAAGISWFAIYLSSQSSGPSWMDLMLLFLAFLAICVRGARPYLMEIILLERNPVRAKKEGDVSVASRSRTLHGPNTGDLLGRWFAAACISIALFVSFLCTAWFVSGMVFLRWEWGSWMIHFVVPLALWSVAGFMAVVRFLGYMDLRIRNEGWEIELLLRAAADRLKERP